MTDKGRGHDRRLLVALFSYQYKGKSLWRARCPVKWWEHSPLIPSSECDLGFKSGHGSAIMWAEFVVGSLPCSEWFSPGTPGFPSSQKQTLPNSNSIWNALTSLKQVLYVCKQITFTRMLLWGSNECCWLIKTETWSSSALSDADFLGHTSSYSFIRWHSLAVVQHPSAVQHF